MRRADRLFQIIQILRSATRHPVTAQQLSEELETSTRTIYRDIADLMVQQIPIRGEAGIGYVLDSSYDMPPLMLMQNELDAALLGAQWVANQGDPELTKGARDFISKIRDVIPQDMRPLMLDSLSMAPKMHENKVDAIDMQQLRSFIRSRQKLHITYEDAEGHESERLIWPIAIAYFEMVRLIVAWCEKRQGFRHFRTDRIKSWKISGAIFQTPVAQLRKQWRERESLKS